MERHGTLKVPKRTSARRKRDCSLQPGYEGFLTRENFPLLRDPRGLLRAILVRTFLNWKERYRIPWEELFHEAVLALWLAKAEWEEYQREEPARDPAKAFVGFAWQRVRWHLSGYLRAMYARRADEIPLSQLVSGEEPDEYWDLQERMSTHPQELEALQEFRDLLEEILAILQQGIQGTGARQVRPDVLARYRKILAMAAAGYNPWQIAEEIGFADANSVHWALDRVRARLLADPEFIARYGGSIAGAAMNIRHGYKGPRAAGRPTVRGRIRTVGVPPSVRAMSLKEIMAEYGISRSTAWRLKTGRQTKVQLGRRKRKV